MMKNIKFIIEYDGTGYCGWQRQKGQRSIQEVIEKALSDITRENVTLYGSGRTDAGVHALAQVADFFTSSRLSPRTLQKAVNSRLPKDIVITGAARIPKDFNARRSAKSKTYVYRIHNAPQRPVIHRNFVAFYRESLDVEKMKSAAKVLRGKHDFRAFCSKSSNRQDCVRKITRINVARKGSGIHIRVTGDGFLYNMVRAIAGTLILAGRGKLSAAGVKKILHSTNRKLAGPTAPAKGLCLVKVEY